METIINQTSSFKDRTAQVVINNDDIYRIIYETGADDYEMLMNSGLYEELVQKGYLISHQETENFTDCYKTIKPQKVFITYPYEWCFSQLKDAALLTLKIQQTAMKYNMSLKDANAFNVQFFKGNPIFIDTTSFERYKDNTVWYAYNQFCCQFAAPLALMSKVDIGLSSLFLKDIDGINLKLASKLLPRRTFFDLSLFKHIHLHSFFQNQYSDTKQKININFSKLQMEFLISDLQKTILNIKMQKQKSEWGEYYGNTNYSPDSFAEKIRILENYKQKIPCSRIADFGANSGRFSRIFKDKAEIILACDIDNEAVEKNYMQVKDVNETNILPLLVDICNPSPAIGWANCERFSLFERIKNIDTILALALIHHLTIGKNLPFEKIAQTFSFLTEYLVIEFVEKNDSQVQKLLKNREDIFFDYTQQNFEDSFKIFFEIIDRQPITDTKRILYLMRKK